MYAEYQNTTGLESFGKWLMECSVALFITYFILPPLADEYNYRFHLQTFLKQLESKRIQLDYQLSKASPKEWQQTAKDAGDQLVAVVRNLTNYTAEPKGPSPTRVFVVSEEPKNNEKKNYYPEKIPGVQPEDVVYEGKRWLGVRYRWGGNSKIYGTDCSGFTQSVFGRFGVQLPRTVAQQFQLGVYVPKSNLQPGDLVFFSTYKPGASHVGIYAGNSRFIHASSATGMVKMDSLNGRYFRRRYLASRRLLGLLRGSVAKCLN